MISDPLVSSLSGDLHKVADVRRALDPLARVARETGAVIVAIMHLNKGSTAAVSDRVSGSHSFRDAARSVFLFATDPDTGSRVVSQDKGNYSAAGAASIAFTLDSVTVPTDDGLTTTVGQVRIIGESDVSVGDILARAATVGDNEQADRNEAQAFVVDYLRGTPELEAPAADVLKAGRAAGFSENDLKHARQRCKRPRIHSQKSGFGRGWVWVLDPDSDSEATEGATKEPKVPGNQSPAPSAPSVAPSTPAAEDGLALLSPVDPPPPSICDECGTSLRTTESIEDGVCSSCRIAALDWEESA